jgi:RNA exonuclease 1
MIQERLLPLLTPHTILIGHSLNADLRVLKITHPFIIDTSILYQHPRGPPLKSSLKWLAQKYLNREIQKGHGVSGHDSVEDARACLDLVKLKCERGPQWGTSEATGESVFKRLSRTPKTHQASSGNGMDCKRGAIVDHGAPEKNFGAMASYCIGCSSDSEVVAGVKRAVLGDPDGEYIPGGGVEFTWARFRELENLRGWAHESRHPATPAPTTSCLPPAGSLSGAALGAAVSQTVQHIKTVREFLPPCTLLVVYSGTGDPREMSRLHEMQRTFKQEYASKKWDELSVKWTDAEEQALRSACRTARQGLGFVKIV